MTADASKLRELSDRCEAEGPSNELDEAIRVAVGHSKIDFGPAQGGVSTEDDYLPAAYTTSLDAAVTLEMPGFFVTVVKAAGSSSEPCAVSWMDIESGAQFMAEAKTEAMARCAAALKVRASLAEPHVEATP